MENITEGEPSVLPDLTGLNVGIQYKATGIAQQALEEAGVMLANDYLESLFTCTYEHPAISAARIAIIDVVATSQQAEV